MSESQQIHFRQYLERQTDPAKDTLHHGDCIGADTEAADIAFELGYTDDRIIVHPSTLEHKRAHNPHGTVLPVKPPLERNTDIAKACTILIACPNTTAEQQRSGTWATVRRARAAGKLVLFCH